MPLTKKNTTGGGGEENPLKQIAGIFARHVDTKPHYIFGTALWAFHTHKYLNYDKSPRLAINSPVPDCGKSTVLDILGSMVWNGKRLIDPTVATTFRLASKHTMLIDEVDNMSMVRSMKAILNAGHSRDGSVTRTGKDGEVISYPVYGPVALASIGRLPSSLMSRSLIIKLHHSPQKMEPFIASEQYHAPAFYNWAEQANLNPKPQMPAQLIGRIADKWRPLIANCGLF
jgi:hypothetical protein